MYSLALALGLASTYALQRWANAVAEDRRARPFLICYVVLSALLLHALYYGGFLILAQMTWTAWRFRMARDALRSLAIAAVAILLLCIPWWSYTVPRLIQYVGGKVQSDQDQPLGLITYSLRHALAFTAGPVRFDRQVLGWLAYVGLATLIPAALAGRYGTPLRKRGDNDTGAVAIQLWTLVLLPSALAFLVNLRLPFFPDSGERLLLFVLPYFLLLVSLGVFGLANPFITRLALASPLVVASIVGLVAFYTIPRYVEDDYRPIISQVAHQGSDRDTVLALFPWQVGYWRAYSPRVGSGALLPPQPEPVGQDALQWDSDLQARIDAALDRGVLWFPAPLSLGSTLPSEIEAYLRSVALDVENRWHGASTRLTAWAEPPSDLSLIPVGESIPAEPGSLTLEAAALSPHAVPNDNAIVAVALKWTPPSDPAAWHITMRLRDDNGRDWGGRDYQQPGSFGVPAGVVAGEGVDVFGLNIPAGVPPGNYRVLVGWVQQARNGSAMSLEDTPLEMVEAGRLQVEVPTVPISPHRLPVTLPARGARQSSAIQIVGAAGLFPELTFLAGTYLDFKLGLFSTTQPKEDFDLSVLLLGQDGAAAAGWQGWPLPGYPTSAWKSGAVALAPIDLYLPAHLPSGRYALTARLSDSQGQTEPPQTLAPIKVVTRTAVYDRMEPQSTLPEPVQFGTHVRLYGYDLDTYSDRLEVTLYWEALQTLLPPHHIFVHVIDQSAAVIAQDDGPPVSPQGPAPTGSWRSGEFISTQHEIVLPRENGDVAPSTWRSLRVGLYEPLSGVRLPAFAGGQPAGDSFDITERP